MKLCKQFLVQSEHSGILTLIITWWSSWPVCVISGQEREVSETWRSISLVTRSPSHLAGGDFPLKRRERPRARQGSTALWGQLPAFSELQRLLLDTHGEGREEKERASLGMPGTVDAALLLAPRQAPGTMIVPVCGWSSQWLRGHHSLTEAGNCSTGTRAQAVHRCLWKVLINGGKSLQPLQRMLVRSVTEASVIRHQWCASCIMNSSWGSHALRTGRGPYTHLKCDFQGKALQVSSTYPCFHIGNRHCGI